MTTVLASSAEECNSIQYPILVVPTGVGDHSGSRWIVTDRENLLLIWKDAVKESYDGKLGIIEVGGRSPKQFWNTNAKLESWPPP